MVKTCCCSSYVTPLSAEMGHVRLYVSCSGKGAQLCDVTEAALRLCVGFTER